MIQPIQSQVLVKLINLENKTKSGLILSDEQSYIQFAEVVNTAKNVKDIVKNDIVFFSMGDAKPIKHENVDYLSIHNNNILGILEK